MRCQLQAAGLLTAAAALSPCHAIASTGRFDVLVTLRAPDGCLFSTQAGANASSQFLTVTCPSNLFVNVQPTIIASPASSASPAAADVGAALAATFSTASQGGEVRGPSELSNSVLTQASTGTLTDARSALNGAIFIERRTGSSSAGTLTSVQLSSDTTAPQASNPTDQLVEMWLTF